MKMNRKFLSLALLLGALMALVHAPAMADRTPDWMVGTFESDARSNGSTILLRVTSQGSLSASLRSDGQNPNDGRNRLSVSASYRGDILTVDDRDYTVVRTNDGFRAVPSRNRSRQGNDRNSQDNDRFAQIFFHRVDNYNGNGQDNRGDGRTTLPADQRPPDWMVGRFTGSNRRDSQTINLSISRQGYLSATSRGSGQNSDRPTVSYRSGQLTIDNSVYRVEQSNNGFTAIPRNSRNRETNDRNGQIDFRRIGDYNDDRQGNRNDQRLPDWMVGRFEGYSRRDSQTISLRISSQGSLSATGRGSARNSDRVTASYRRDLLTINDTDYTVERTNNGFRAIPTGDRNSQGNGRNNEINFRRLGDYNN